MQPKHAETSFRQTRRREHKLELALVLLTLPILPPGLQSLRALRLLRLLRLAATVSCPAPSAQRG